MSNKVLLILADGMRPDGIIKSGHPFYEKLLEHSKYSLNVRTVMPSVTLPCHMSLFHSVDPDRHGILTNTYVPQVRPVRSLCDVLSAAGKKCAMFYDWEQLRDLNSPGSLVKSSFISGGENGYEASGKKNAAFAADYLSKDAPDFTFLYFGIPDAAGHGYGWMGEEYIKAINFSFDWIEKVVNAIPDDFTVFITADHGGHDRGHGTDMPEDMTIPLVIYNKTFEKEQLADGFSIIDIAPTITKLLDCPADKDWEGKIIF